MQHDEEGSTRRRAGQECWITASFSSHAPVALPAWPRGVLLCFLISLLHHFCFVVATLWIFAVLSHEGIANILQESSQQNPGITCVYIRHWETFGCSDRARRAAPQKKLVTTQMRPLLGPQQCGNSMQHRAGSHGSRSSFMGVQRLPIAARAPSSSRQHILNCKAVASPDLAEAEARGECPIMLPITHQMQLDAWQCLSRPPPASPTVPSPPHALLFCSGPCTHNTTQHEHEHEHGTPHNSRSSSRGHAVSGAGRL